MGAGALVWEYAQPFGVNAWWPFWAIVAACVCVLGAVGGYRRARVVGFFGCLGVLATAGLAGDRLPLLLVSWESFDQWPVAAAAMWALPAWLLRNSLETHWAEVLALVLISAFHLLLFVSGAGFFKVLMEAAFAFLMHPSARGGIGGFYKRMGVDRHRDRRANPAGGGRVAAVEVQTERQG